MNNFDSGNRLMLVGHHVPPTLEPRYMWRPEWLARWQTPWSVIERFRYVNNLTNREAYSVLGREPKHGKLSNRRQDLFTLGGLDDNAVIRHLSISFESSNNRFIQEFLRPIGVGEIPLRNVFQTELKWCGHCIQDGFHSYFHQLRGMRICVYHGTDLIQNCPHCGRTFSYAFGDGEFSAPFRCSCGFDLLGESDGVWQLARWTRNYYVQTSGFATIPSERSHPELATKNDSEYPVILTFPCNSVLNVPWESLVHLSSHGPSGDGMYTFSAEHDGDSLKDANRNVELWETVRSVTKSIARQIRRQMQKRGHRGCARELTNYIGLGKFSFCPIAFAYLKWRQEVDNIDEYWKVDTGRWGDTSKDWQYFAQWGVHKWDMSLLQFYSSLLNQLTLSSHTGALRWLLSRVVGHSLVMKFRKWEREGQYLDIRDDVYQATALRNSVLSEGKTSEVEAQTVIHVTSMQSTVPGRVGLRITVMHCDDLKNEQV